MPHFEAAPTDILGFLGKREPDRGVVVIKRGGALGVDTEGFRIVIVIDGLVLRRSDGGDPVIVAGDRIVVLGDLIHVLKLPSFAQGLFHRGD